MPNIVESVGPQYLTKSQAQIYTGLCERTLDYARERGEVEAFKIGKRVLLSRASLDAYIQRHRIGTSVKDLLQGAGEVTV
jgi:hypothetical protein